MSELLKTIAGFLGILLVVLVGVAVSNALRVGNTNTSSIVIDNVG